MPARRSRGSKPHTPPKTDRHGKGTHGRKHTDARCYVPSGMVELVIRKVKPDTRLPDTIRLEHLRPLRRHVSLLGPGSIAVIDADFLKRREIKAKGKAPDLSGFPYTNHALMRSESVIVKVDQRVSKQEFGEGQVLRATVLYRFNKDKWCYERLKHEQPASFHLHKNSWPPIRDIREVELVLD